MTDPISTTKPKKKSATTVCRKCNFTVYVVEIDGGLVYSDAELITVVTQGTSPAVIRARRSHDESCTLNRTRAERIKAQKARIA